MKALELVAPWLWRLEVVNALLIGERQKRLSASELDRFLGILDGMDVEFVSEPMTRSLKQLGLFAKPHQLTSYDAVYVEMSLNLGLPLYTLDKNQILAAKRLRIKVIE